MYYISLCALGDTTHTHIVKPTLEPNSITTLYTHLTLTSPETDRTPTPPHRLTHPHASPLKRYGYEKISRLKRVDVIILATSG